MNYSKKKNDYLNIQAIVSWIFRAKFAVIGVRANIMEFIAAMAVLDFSNVQYIEIAFTHAKQRAILKDGVQWIKLIAINAVHAVCPNAFNQP